MQHACVISQTRIRTSQAGPSQVTRPEASSVTCSVWVKVREVKLLEIGRKVSPCHMVISLRHVLRSKISWTHMPRCRFYTLPPAQWTIASQNTLCMHHATYTVRATDEQRTCKQSTKYVAMAKFKDQQLVCFVFVFLSLSLFLSIVFLMCAIFMHTLMHFQHIHWKRTSILGEGFMGTLLNHRPITIITRQSIQRLHMHMATNKAPRMPRPRDFWVNAMALMSKLAPKKST